jgi:hypothetical protein
LQPPCNPDSFKSVIFYYSPWPPPRPRCPQAPRQQASSSARRALKQGPLGLSKAVGFWDAMVSGCVGRAAVRAGQVGTWVPGGAGSCPLRVPHVAGCRRSPLRSGGVGRRPAADPAMARSPSPGWPVRTMRRSAPGPARCAAGRRAELDYDTEWRQKRKPPRLQHGAVFQYVMPGNCSRACSSWSAHSRGQPKARAACPLISAAAAPLVKWTYSPQFIRRV